MIHSFSLSLSSFLFTHFSLFWPSQGALPTIPHLLSQCAAFTDTPRSDYYCHKRFAPSMVGFGVDINAPRMPFVTTTLMSRPFEWLWRPALGFLAWVLRFWLNLVFGPPEPVRRRGRIVDNPWEAGYSPIVDNFPSRAQRQREGYQWMKPIGEDELA